MGNWMDKLFGNFATVVTILCKKGMMTGAFNVLFISMTTDTVACFVHGIF